MKVYFRTNLDLDRHEEWPKDLPSVPNVGDLIESAYVHEIFDADNKKHASTLTLEVVRVTWKLNYTNWIEGKKEWCPNIELHLPRNWYENLTGFYTWYGKITGHGKYAFV